MRRTCAGFRPEVALAAAAPAAEASLYLAPDVLLAGNFATLVTRWLAPHALVAWRHPRAVSWRDLAEAAALAAPPERRAAALDQARECEAAGLPAEAGAIDTRLLWRRHKTAAAAALAEAWWRAFARHPGDADLALARALAAPDAPAAPRLLPAALGTAEHNLYTAVSPVGLSPAPRRPAPGRRPGSARLKIAIVHQRGYEHYASTLLRAEQLAGLLAERLGGRYEFSYTAETDGLRDQVVVLTKWALERRRPAEIAALRAKNVAVIASWDDKIPLAELAAVVDAQMTLSIAQAVDLGRRFPATPTYFVTHHVNRLIRPGAPPMDRLRAGYFGELFNTVRPDSLAGEIALNGIDTTPKAAGPTAWMDALDRYNLHWIVRQRHYFDGAKPFLKGFVAARCGAVVMVARRRRRRGLLPRRRLSVLCPRARPRDARGRLAAGRLRLRRAGLAHGRGDHAPGRRAQRRRRGLRPVRGDDRGDHGLMTMRRLDDALSRADPTVTTSLKFAGAGQ